MCGIAGLALPDHVLHDAALVRVMADRLAHRGPDAHGVLAMPGCTFGHRRLSIVDLSDLAAQPMRSPDESAMLTFNGEIYDFAALRDELVSLGYVFRSRSDTEVLLHALDAWGDAALQRIHGMFAFGHWSARDRALTLVAAAGCGSESGLKSTRYDPATSLRFKNATKHDVTYYWINYEGRRDQMRTLKAGETEDRTTFVTHPFVVVNGRDACVAVYMPLEKPGLVVITDGPK